MPPEMAARIAPAGGLQALHAAFGLGTGL